MSRWAALREARAWRGAALVMALLGLLSIPWWAPRTLSRLAFFDVRHVQVVGTVLLDPADIAARMAIDTTRSVWEDHSAIAARLTGHPQIATARIRKRLPNTLVVEIAEVPPVAFVASARGLHAVDAHGDTLPLDPLEAGVSLPIVSRADTAVLRLLGSVREEAPALFGRISEVRRAGDDEVVLVMPPLRVRAHADLSSERLADILPVERDLARRKARAVELDLRFRDQVVARVQ